MQKNRRCAVALLILMLAGSVSASTFPDDWNCRSKIVMQSSFIGSDLTAHPEAFNWKNLPWELTSSNSPFPPQSDGGDIRLTTDEAGTTLLAIDVPSSFALAANPSASLAAFFAALNRTAASNDNVYVWWNTAATESQPGRAEPDSGSDNVWISNYKLVAHFEETGTGDDTTLLDATSFGNDFDRRGTPLWQQAGVVGYAGGFDSIDYYKRAPDGDFNGDFNSTIEAWVYPTGESGTGNGRVFTITSGATGDARALSNATSGSANNRAHMRIQYGFGPTTVSVLATTASETSDNNWAHWAYTYSRTDSMRLFIDGVQDTAWDVPTTFPFNANDSLGVGGHPNDGDHNRFFKGRIDELRYSDFKQTPDWISATVANINDAAGYALDEPTEYVGSGIWWNRGTSNMIDSWIDADNDATNYGSDTVMLAGDFGGTTIERVIISMSGLVANIGTDKNITSASWFVMDQNPLLGTGNFDLHGGLNDSAKELEVTWLLAQTGDNWQTAGAQGANDYNSTPMSTVSLTAAGIYEFAIDTAFANAALQGNDTLSFVFRVTAGAGRIHEFTSSEAGANQPGFKFVFESLVTDRNYRHSPTDVGERHNPDGPPETARHSP